METEEPQIVDDFQPRDYQVTLREIAIKRNSIIYLPTGSGKTFIAILVLKHLQQSNLKYSDGGKISFVVVNTVALVDQHAKCIEKRTNLLVGRYSGDMNVDFWPKTKWYEEFDKYHVFVMTIQILVNLTNQNYLDLNKVNLIVFDECHRGVSDQPMRQLCKSLENVKTQPRILGLTATLLNGNCKPENVLGEVRNLEITYHSQVATADGLDKVAGYSTNPKEIVIVYKKEDMSTEQRIALTKLQELISILLKVNDSNNSHPTFVKLNDLKPLEKEQGLKKLINTLSDAVFHIELFGIYGGSKALLAHIIQIERLRKHCDEINLHCILSYVESILYFIKNRLDKVMEAYNEERKILLFSTEKVLKLIAIFHTYSMKSKEPLCALVFTKRRFTAKIVYYILDSLSKCERFSNIKANFIVGYNANPFNDTREVLYNSKKNKEVLQSFENKEINVLCASNVLEEGVDISTCSLVIKFDHPEDYRSYIQSKGRARHPSSLFYMMVDSTDYLKFMSRYQEFQKVENSLQRLLVGQNKWRQEPSLKEIQQMYEEDELPPYYVSGPGSAKVDMVSAVSLLSQYCMSLPCDKYTVLAPELYKKEIKIGEDIIKLSVTIVLPTICPWTEPITGVPMSSIKSAKRAAALKACELLHKLGELDDHLLPKKNIIKEEDVSFLFSHYPREKELMAGTNKNKRKHFNQIPNFVRGALRPNQPVWLHLINLQPVFEKKNELNQSTFYEMYASNLCYGLITPHSVPTVCDYPIYVTLGTLNVHLDVNVTSVALTEENIADIRNFHFIVLHDIIEVITEFVAADNGDDAETMLLVPVNKMLASIDFDVLKEYKSVKRHWEPLTSDERLSLQVSEEAYLRKIVSPWYRDMGRVCYLVVTVELGKTSKSKFPYVDLSENKLGSKMIKLTEDLNADQNADNHYLVTETSFIKTAKSEFPNEQFATYEDYYKEKHDVRLLNPLQPLLYVKHLTKKLNFFKPQGAQAKRKKEKNYEELETHLIPELVVKQEFPASLWIQANLLPTMLSRFSFLFRLEEFRVKMTEEMEIASNLSAVKKPLELDEYLLNYEPHLEKSSPINIIAPEVNEDSFEVNTINSVNINKDYIKKLLEQEYPWKDSDEPKDIERDLNVTLMDIEYYETFLSKKVSEPEFMIRNEVSHKNKRQLALTYYKDYQEKTIQLIENNNWNNGPDLNLIYKAMTTAKANDIVNMERLETLGDSFLKYFSSVYIYLKFPRYTEGLATLLKGRLVSNKNLYYLACQKNIGGLMKCSDLQISDWRAPGFAIPDLMRDKIASNKTSLASIYHISIPTEEQISGNLSENTIRLIRDMNMAEDPSEEGLIQDVASFFKCNYVGDKKVADCVEALLGAWFQTCGIAGGIRFMEWMNIIPKSEKLSELLQQAPVNPVLNQKSTLADINYHIQDYDKIENDILKYRFKNRGYLLQALTHSSYSPNRITQSYEKLEFVGDAILDFLITCHIFESCGNLDPGQLTDLRSALVNNNTFASLVVRNNIHKHLLMINAKLQGMIDRFAEFIESKRFEIDDEVLILLEEADGTGMNLAEYIDVPKVLGDVFEALAGAIYLDSGKDLKVVWKVFHRLMWKEIETFSANVPKNLVRKLYEWTPNPHPKFGVPKDAEQGKVMIPLQFIQNGRRQQVYGFGSNKMMAKKAAAKLALRQLN